jgi:flagellar L-ring protein FlgH
MINRLTIRDYSKFIAMAAGIFIGCGLNGCAGGLSGLNGPVQSPPVAYTPVPAAPVQAAPVPAASAAVREADTGGSLWHEDAPLIAMFSDQKARNVGDIVTIRISESSAATNEASTETDRSSSLGAGLDSFFGAENRYTGTDPFFNPFSRVAGGAESEFEGTGSTKRSGDLNAYITALVTQVLPNGNLVVSGSREVLINNENQVIRLTGVVRPRDIDADNQVLSTYVADARISYSGNGIVDDRQKPGWLTNIVMKVWPF